MKKLVMPVYFLFMILITMLSFNFGTYIRSGFGREKSAIISKERSIDYIDAKEKFLEIRDDKEYFQKTKIWVKVKPRLFKFPIVTRDTLDDGYYSRDVKN